MIVFSPVRRVAFSGTIGYAKNVAEISGKTDYLPFSVSQPNRLPQIFSHYSFGYHSLTSGFTTLLRPFTSPI